jgi:hypothetical protein
MQPSNSHETTLRARQSSLSTSEGSLCLGKTRTADILGHWSVTSLFPATLSFFGTSLSYAAITVALLFGLIHLEVNPITAGAALVLGLFSGELRQRNGSLLPAILVHTVFNAFAAIL